MSGSVLDRAAREPDRSLRYAAGDTGLVDVYSPRVHPRGFVVIVHGGFWRAQYDRAHLRPLAEALAADGLKVALPEYRRVGDVGGGWPGSLDDVAEALAVLPTELGFDAAATVVAGHSAGGHLALLAAARTDTAPARVVSLAGVVDMRAALRDRLSNGAAADFLGGGATSAAAIADSDPMGAEVVSEVVLIHGERDAQVPVSYSRAYGEAHEGAILRVLPNADHFDLIDPQSDAYETVRAALAGD